MNRREFVGALGGLVAGVAAPVRLERPGVGAGGNVFVERWSWAMGQPVHLQLFASSEARGYEVAQAALAELRRVEAVLTLFDDGSDLCALNRLAGQGPEPVAPDLAAVLSAGEGFRAVTGGAFDPAVEPLMRAWGFHAARSSPPTAAELAEARAAVRAATVRVAGGTVALGSATTRLDLGGIGVGYGLDRMADVLHHAGIRRAFLDVSGDCLAIGAPPGETGWLVEVADPADPRRVIGGMRLRNAALATSSNTVSVIRWGRALRGHVMDPATGYPATALVQATVVARTGIEADALSTAMLVSGCAPTGALRTFRVIPTTGSGKVRNEGA